MQSTSTKTKNSNLLGRHHIPPSATPSQAEAFIVPHAVIIKILDYNVEIEEVTN